MEGHQVESKGKVGAVVTYSEPMLEDSAQSVIQVCQQSLHALVHRRTAEELVTHRQWR